MAQGGHMLHSTPLRGEGRATAEWRTIISQDAKRKHLSSPEFAQKHCAKCEDELEEDKLVVQVVNLNSV